MEENVENGRLYSFKERLLIILPVLLIGGVCWWFVNFKLGGVLENIHCKTVLSINGFYWLWASFFTGFPLFLFSLVVSLEAQNAIHAVKYGEYPLPSKKVFFNKQILTGTKAKAKGWLISIFVVFLSIFLVWGIYQSFHPPEIQESKYELCRS